LINLGGIGASGEGRGSSFGRGEIYSLIFSVASVPPPPLPRWRLAVLAAKFVEA